jgi:S-adenosyl-L-methionine hydrolase (adenosine-forming)
MPILTLSTDFGQQDYLSGAVKGQFLGSVANLSIADITHHLSAANYAAAAYLCSNAIAYYPPGTFHLVLLDMFSGNTNHFLLAFHNKSFIACADNGLLQMITLTSPELVLQIDTTHANTLLEKTAVLAKAYYQLVNNIEVEKIGDPFTKWIERNVPQPGFGDDWIEGQIIYVDHFENAVINITKEQFETQRKGRTARIEFARREQINQVYLHYNMVGMHDKLAFFNSAGYLEIAIKNGNIAGLFGLKCYNEQATAQQNAEIQKQWLYQSVRIFFS